MKRSMMPCSKWSTFMRGNNIPINGPILLEKALEFDT